MIGFHNKILLSMRCGLSKRWGISHPIQRLVVQLVRVAWCWKCPNHYKWILQHEAPFGKECDWAYVWCSEESLGNTSWEVVLSPSSAVSHHSSMLLIAQLDKHRNDKLWRHWRCCRGGLIYATTTVTEDIQYIETTNKWSQWHDELAEAMFTEWQLRNA